MRAYNRYEYKTEVKIEYEGENFVGLSKNISQGGMFIEITKEFNIGNILKLKFKIPTLNTPIETQAQVRWVQRKDNTPTGIGVQFLLLKPIEVWAINQLGKLNK